MCTHFICEQESLEKVSRKAVYVTMCHFVLFRTPTVLKLVISKRRLGSSIPVFAYYFEQTIGVDYYWIYYRRQCCSLRRVVFKINRGNRWWNILNKRKLNTHVSLFTHQIMTCAQSLLILYTWWKFWKWFHWKWTKIAMFQVDLKVEIFIFFAINRLATSSIGIYKISTLTHLKL